ncbi:hypothetical protein DFQ26_006860 [Actinomortierella ambigua]|nr:hypothetical protein DFQ26_006860 [Actinomortierella ambigua]
MAMNIHSRGRGQRAGDVEIEIRHCSIYGSDIHTMTEGWGPLCHGPYITGHEIIGQVVARSDKVSAKLSLGDRVGVGTMVDSCKECELCQQGLDQQCKMVFTYNDAFKDAGRPGVTYDDYADHIRVHAEWAFKTPEEISSAEICHGQLARYNTGLTKRVGVLGLGGLGHLSAAGAGVGIGTVRAFDSKDVVVVATSDSKHAEAKKLGAT